MCFLLADRVAAQADDVAKKSADLRERLTEREDENRLENPYSVDLMGRPLFLSGQFELAFDFLGRSAVDQSDHAQPSLLFEPGLEGELFYSPDEHVSVFAQVRLAMERELRDGSPERISTRFVERGEMWVSVLDVADSGLDLEIGRLDFEDDRTWWWDVDLDALRLSHEGRNFDVALAVARELAPARSDRDYIEPEHDGVSRLIFEASWDWSPNHSLQAFGLRHRDDSMTDRPDVLVQHGREDAADGQLTWLGLRASGAWGSDERGLLGYWFDIASVRGHEQLVEYEETAEFSRAGESARQAVRGWAYDVGATWVSPLPAEPRFSLGLARGSGDSNGGDGVDRSFRQTGLQSNDVGFGGVQRLGRFGRVLDPELSNLSIATLDLGISLLQSSSLDLLYHRYRLIEPADALRGARIDAELSGDRDIGHAFDLVLAVEEWQRLELELSASAFKPGGAFGDEGGDWVLGGFLAVRIAF